MTLQRDYFLFKTRATKKKSTELSNTVPIYTGWTNNYPTVTWIAGTQVDAAFQTLAQLINQLSQGSYQVAVPPGQGNPGIWPVASINYPYLLSLYAYYNPAYTTYLANNNITVPVWPPPFF